MSRSRRRTRRTRSAPRPMAHLRLRPPAAGSETQPQSATPKPAAAPAAEASAKPAKTAKPVASPKAQAPSPRRRRRRPRARLSRRQGQGRRDHGRHAGGRLGCAVRDDPDDRYPASAEASPGASPEASPSGSAAPEVEGPAVALPADNPASDGGPAGSDVLAAPPVEEPDVTPRLEIPADELDLVVPERVGDVVAPAPVKIGKKALSIPVSMPAVPGKYRLTITLHDKDGVVYDAATQALIPSLIVRVTGDFDGAILATPTAEPDRRQRGRARRPRHQPRPDRVGPRGHRDCHGPRRRRRAGTGR